MVKYTTSMTFAVSWKDWDIGFGVGVTRRSFYAAISNGAMMSSCDCTACLLSDCGILATTVFFWLVTGLGRSRCIIVGLTRRSYLPLKSKQFWSGPESLVLPTL